MTHGRAARSAAWWTVAASLGAGLAGCDGGMPDAGPAIDAGPRDAGGALGDAGPGPDAATRDDDAGSALHETAHVLWLNVAGRGMTDPFGNPWEIPAFTVVPRPGGLLGSDAFAPGWRDARDAAIADLVERVRAIFAPFDVEVSTRRPVLDGYVEVVIGGSDLDRGRLAGCDTRIGFASLLCSSLRRDERRVAHVLSECIGDGPDHELGPRMRAEVIAHEVGHALGLEHVDDSGSIMFPSGLGRSAWGSGTVIREGADTSGAGCGRATQDCAAVLAEQLGPARPRGPAPMPDDLEPPRFDVLSPADGQHVHPDASPCVRVSDASALSGHVHLELYVHVPELDGQYYRLGHAHAEGPAPDLVTFGALSTGVTGTVFLRVTAGDAHGNLAEERVSVVIDPDAPTIACP